MSDTLYIVDTFSLVFQVYHAIRQPMTGTRGQPTNAVYGFTGDMKHLLNEVHATHLVCAMESPEPGIRKELFADYKANRSEMPEDLRPQIPIILDVVDAYGVPVISHAGWEADDVMATLATKAVEEGFDVCLVTNDKDARQLLGPHVSIYNIRKRKLLTSDDVVKEWGVRPDQVIDFQALVGDSVDNVPGVPLVGPKKAGALLQQFGTLDEVLAHADEAPGKKLQENLHTYADQARLSRELVTLRTDLPLEFSWDATAISLPDKPRLLELFTDLGFRRHSDEIRESLGESDEPAKERTWTVIRTGEAFGRFLEQLQAQSRFCFDLETTSVDAMRADIVGWAFCWETHRSYYIPVDGPPGDECLEPKTVREALKPLLENPDIELVNQNIKYELLVLRRVGINARGISLDPMIGDYLLDAGARSHGLDKLSKQYLQHTPIPISDLIGKGKQQKKMFEVDVDQAAEYASEDADLTWQLAEIITKQLKQENLFDLYWNLERPLIEVLADMEYQGIRVDTNELRRQSEQLSLRLAELMEQIHSIAGHEFNIDSPKQLATVLFDECNLPPLKRTKTGPSTSQDVLEKLAALHPLPEKIIEHRHLSKLKGTYLDALPSLVHPETGNIHASFNQVVAATGRLSSSDPNLQNIPIRTAEGRQIRRAFIPSQPGWKLLSADYSQIELRLLAHFSGDDELRKAFQEGIDIHTAVAAEIFDVDPADVDADMRRISKAVNFGIMYGQSAFGLSEVLKIDRDQAATFIDNYFERFSQVGTYFEELLDECEHRGYVETIMGRRRQITGVRKPRPPQRNLPERTAINTIMQGSAADLIKQAMINLHRRLIDEQLSGRMLLQIHDELVFEVPEEDVVSLAAVVQREMQSALTLTVPLVVDVKAGDNWLDAEPLERE